jgi:hypothetical protein
MPIDENMGNYGNGKIPKFDDDEPTLIQLMADGIEKYYVESGSQKLFECDEPGKTFGWKIDSKGVRLVECGCYNEAVWPAILSLGLGPILKTIGTKVAQKITKKLYKKYVKILQNELTKYALRKFRSSSIAIRQGLSSLLELPPVPDGYIRIWRGEGSKVAHKTMQCSSKNIPTTTSGRWGSPRRSLANRYAIGSGPISTPIEDQFLYYLDLPVEEAKLLSPGYQGPGAKWPFLTDNPANLGDDVRIITGPIFDQKGNRLGEVKRLDDGKVILEGNDGKIYDAVSQNFHKPNDTPIIGRTNDNFKYTLPRPTIIKRKKPDGSIEKVLDIPVPEDIDLNPQLFPYTENSALHEVFLTEEWIGKFKLAKPDSTEQILDEIVCREILLDEHISKLAKDSEFAEQWLNPENFNLRQQYKDQLFDLTDDWGDTIKKYADEDTISSTDLYIDDIKSVNDLTPGSGTKLALLLSKFSGLLTFAIGVFSYATIVIDKECSPLLVDETYKNSYDGPTDHRIPSDIQARLVQIVDSVFFQGRWKGGSWDGSILSPSFSGGNCAINTSIAAALGNNPSWKTIEQVLIDNKLPIWPQITETCECSSCPSGYQLCSYSSIINGWSDIYNICLPVCGGQGVQPLQIENVVTKANCEVKCPDGYMWVKCATSECDRSKCRDGSDTGFCVKIPDSMTKLIDNGIDTKYGKILWDPLECKWVCYSGRWVMDWTANDGAESEGPVYSDDARFDKKVYLPPSGPGGIGKYVPAYRFRADRYEAYESSCDEPFIRDPDDDCKCSGSYENIGIPEVPPGYVLYDGDVVLISDN